MSDDNKTPAKPEPQNESPKLLKIVWDYICYVPFICAAKTIQFLPDKICYKLASICGTIFFLADIPLALRAIRNLRHSGVAKGFWTAALIARKSFISFMKLSVDIFKARDKMTGKDLTQTCTINAPESTIKALFPGNGQKGRQAILAGAHFGNWEIIGQNYFAASGLVMSSIMRPFDNKLVGDYITSRRCGLGPDPGHDVFDKKGGIRSMLKALKKGATLGLLVDQHASRKDGGIEVKFFGQPARTHATPARLHLQTGHPLYVLLCRRVSDEFKFEFLLSEEIRITPSGDMQKDIEAITQKINDEIEAIIRRYPEQWLWAHRRWLNLDRS